jgi:hypothetical protein
MRLSACRLVRGRQSEGIPPSTRRLVKRLKGNENA